MPAIVPASVRTMALFEIFAREKRELSNKEIARFLELPESSTSDLLYTLHQHGYLMRTAKTRRFFPTGRLGAIASGINEDDRLQTVAAEAVEMLSSKTMETSFFGRLDNGAVRVLAVQEGSHALRYVLKAGERIALHASAMGKAILSLLPPEDASRYLRGKPLRKVASRTVVDIEAIEKEIAGCRKTHVAKVDSEGTEGVAAFAIAGMIGLEPVAFSCAGPSDRLNALSDAYLKALHEVAAVAFSESREVSTDRA